MAGDPKNRGAEARARYAANRNGSNSWQPSEFINVNLTDAENKAKRAWCSDYAELFLMLHEEIENGYKFNCKWDERGSCSAVFMQSASDEGPNAGYILTGRASTISGAFREVLFIHRQLLGGNWSDAALLRHNDREADAF